MTARPIPTAILGASGYIGQHFARLLADHPEFGLPRLVATERSGGKRLADVWQLAEPPPASMEEALLEPLSVGQIIRSGVQVVFSALPSGTAGPIESKLSRRGIAVFTNAADHRLDLSVPLLVPEVNADHLALASRVGRATESSWPTRTARPLGSCSRWLPSSTVSPLAPST